MKGLPLVADESSKSGCTTFAILPDGTFVGYNHGPGKLIPVYGGERMTQTQFISNQNAEKNGAWMIGAASYNSFHKMPLDSYMEDIFLMVIRGLFFCHATLRFMLAFHRFKGRGCCHSFCHVVKNHVGTSDIFVRQMFDSECEVVDVDSIYVNYLNQITGPRLFDWTPAASTFEKGGCLFYKSGL